MENTVPLSYSSITRKVIMALAGLFLVTFLLVHLGINLMLLVNDDGRSFSAAAAFMGTNPVIRVFEVVLFGGFALHIMYGALLSFKNRASRPIRYMHRNESETSPLSKYMLHTGIVILIFLVLHFIDFYFVKIGLVSPPPGVDRHDFYRMSIILFTNPWYSLIYALSFLALGFHLNHAIQSAFQTMGLTNSKYTLAVKALSTSYAVIVAGGFMSIPLWFIFFR
jgi:succinate dehydrogenase / fumarate reductase cytochrome b subunit